MLRILPLKSWDVPCVAITFGVVVEETPGATRSRSPWVIETGETREDMNQAGICTPVVFILFHNKPLRIDVPIVTQTPLVSRCKLNVIDPIPVPRSIPKPRA